MNYFSILKSRYSKYFIVGIICSLAGFVAGAIVVTQKQMVVIPIQDAKFTPIDPTQPDGHQIAVLWGDPSKGPSSMLLKFKKGGADLHTHSSDYHLVMLEGTMKHWALGEKEADVKPLNRGSYWFQPGNQAHSGSCLTDECLMFVKWEGIRDGKPVETKNK